MDLQKKRADLYATIETLVGQINRTNGAIALLDDLIAEQAQEEAERKEPPSADPSWVQNPVLEMLPVSYEEGVQ